MIDCIFIAGKKGIEIAFYILLPIMIIMMSAMRFLERIGLIHKIALWISPLFFLLGLPGIGLFAILQVLFISFAAPLSTLKFIETDEKIHLKRIAATLAMILTMSQANATFPLAVKGLNLSITMLTSLLGGFIASFLAYFVFAKKYSEKDEKNETVQEGMDHFIQQKEKKSIIKTIFDGAEEGMQMVLKAIPVFVLALFLVEVLKLLGVIQFLSHLLTPAFSYLGLNSIVVLPILTKWIAGGTAMMGVSIDLMDKGLMTVTDLNRIAGFTIHPFDLVALGIYPTVGQRIASVLKPAMKAALIGIMVRGVLHFIIF